MKADNIQLPVQLPSLFRRISVQGDCYMCCRRLPLYKRLLYI